ncbi:unnamed protein product, partial [Vitis vinifera]|uniref:Uncharacterized protein n=1 Tax=Vitis vinifera TaxID=29760 RepID=D7TTK7_VITVI
MEKRKREKTLTHFLSPQILVRERGRECTGGGKGNLGVFLLGVHHA